jgi:hypothetical protein
MRCLTHPSLQAVEIPSSRKRGGIRIQYAKATYGNRFRAHNNMAASSSGASVGPEPLSQANPAETQAVPASHAPSTLSIKTRDTSVAQTDPADSPEATVITDKLKKIGEGPLNTENSAAKGVQTPTVLETRNAILSSDSEAPPEDGQPTTPA